MTLPDEYCAAAYPTCLGQNTISAQSFVDDGTLAGISAADQQFAEPAQLERLKKYHDNKAGLVL
ncbi:hypothetical protein YA0851_24020 [Pseudomonas synxantha]|uniref:hypothetical protein n=1 Tax=Pseudomonas synxantha TaxID=47883 RepID=UPI0018E5C688|nr:hypothetical protein [Pseudomonas synxantha]MBI6583413.1 hypothetical protein [Pseudomonas synxantha]